MAIYQLLKQNLDTIHDQMAAACLRAGRAVDDVHLIAVTKYAEWSWVESLSALHQQLGENRPQQLAERQMRLPNNEWHLIGQLQRNKVRLALQHASVIHSVDSLRLLERVALAATELQLRPHVLLQINLSGESSKSGFVVEQLRQEWAQIANHAETVWIDGFMTMAAESDNPEDARPVFRSLRLLRDELRHSAISRSAGLDLRQLSMGMSGDFIPAVEEGSTMIRIGSKIFAGLAEHV